MKSVKTRTGEFYLDEEGIFHAIFFANVVVDYEDALDNFWLLKILPIINPLFV